MRRRNLIFVQLDQLHFNALSAYGNPYVKTPNMDRIAKEGYSFMKTHTVMPQCCPARASWFTGLTSKEHGQFVNGAPLRKDIPDLGNWIREAGYETVYTGKWHVGRPTTECFEKVLQTEGTLKGEHMDEFVARSAIGYLQKRTDERPFFLNVSLMNPHDCCYNAAAAGGLGKYRLAEMMAEELPPIPENFVSPSKMDSRGWGELEWRFYIYLYYRLVEMVDAEFGTFFDYLKNSEYAENNLLILSSDHGDGLGFHGKVSKGFLEDESWRVPAIVWGNGIPQNVRDEDHLASSLDIPKTFTDYAGAPDMPNTNFGKSWRPILEGRKPEWREYVFGETSIPYTAMAFRDTQDTKTIFYSDGKIDAYNTAKDPLEKNNLAGNPEAQGLIRRHRTYFKDYLNTVKLNPEQSDLKGQAARCVGYEAWYKQMKEEL